MARTVAGRVKAPNSTTTPARISSRSAPAQPIQTKDEASGDPVEQWRRASRVGHDFARLKVGAEPRAQAGGARPLPEVVRRKAEDALGIDVSGVRLKVDQSPRRFGAHAFTQGESVSVVPDKYRPKSREGQHLLLHELAHVKQQRAGRVEIPRGKGPPVNADPVLEAEADALAARAVGGNPSRATAAEGQRVSAARQGHVIERGAPRPNVSPGAPIQCNGPDHAEVKKNFMRLVTQNKYDDALHLIKNEYKLTDHPYDLRSGNLIQEGTRASTEYDSKSRNVKVTVDRSILDEAASKAEGGDDAKYNKILHTMYHESQHVGQYTRGDEPTKEEKSAYKPNFRKLTVPPGSSKIKLQREQRQLMHEAHKQKNQAFEARMEFDAYSGEVLDAKAKKHIPDLHPEELITTVDKALRKFDTMSPGSQKTADARQSQLLKMREAASKIIYGKPPAKPVPRAPLGPPPAKPVPRAPTSGPPAKPVPRAPLGPPPAKPVPRAPVGGPPAKAVPRAPLGPPPAKPVPRAPVVGPPAKAVPRAPQGRPPAKPVPVTGGTRGKTPRRAKSPAKSGGLMPAEVRRKKWK